MTRTEAAGRRRRRRLSSSTWAVRRRNSRVSASCRVTAMVRSSAAALAVVLLVPAVAFAQAAAAQEAAAPNTLTVSPEELTLTAGETARISATVLDGDGNEVEAEVLYLPLYGQYWNLEERTWGFNLFTVSPDGRVSTVRPGEYAVLVRVVGTARDASVRDSDAGGYLQRRVPLTILPRPPASIRAERPGALPCRAPT